jgi:WD40 repeat protein
MGILVSDEG